MCNSVFFHGGVLPSDELPAALDDGLLLYMRLGRVRYRYFYIGTVLRMVLPRPYLNGTWAKSELRLAKATTVEAEAYRYAKLA